MSVQDALLLVAIVTVVVQALRITLLKAQLATFRQCTIVVTPQAHDPAVGCLGTMLFLSSVAVIVLELTS